MGTETSVSADQVIAALLAREAELRGAGIKSLALFGSVARGDIRQGSDIDLVAELDPEARMDLIGSVGLERELTSLLGRRVQLLPEPVTLARLRANVERDRVRAFQAASGGLNAIPPGSTKPAWRQTACGAMPSSGVSNVSAKPHIGLETRRRR